MGCDYQQLFSGVDLS